MRLVIDTNILVSYLFWPGFSTHYQIAELIGHNEILRSTETFAELSEVVMRKKFDLYLSQKERELFLSAFYDDSIHVLIEDRITDCRDAKDNKFLELAVSGKAQLIISGNQDLLVLDPFRNIRILNPAQLKI